MSRFTGPHPRRGAPAPPAELVDLGKKLLGELQNRIRLGGPPTLILRRTVPAGFVEAKMEYGQPRVFITVNTRQDDDTVFLEGLVVRPSPETSQRLNAATNHIVLSQKTLRPVFFGLAGASPKEQAPFYERLFPNGLRHHGNVDWRNADESVALTFFGPETRYFYSGPGGGSQFQRYVFFKNSLLFDMVEQNDFWDYAEVRGACLREVEGLGPCLYVVIRDYPNPIIERLIRFRVRVPDGIVVKSWKHAPRLEIVRNEDDWYDGEDLGNWEMDDTSYASDHPWHFNQSGTEARCILADQADVVNREWVLDVELASAVVTRTIELPVRTVADSASYEGVYRPTTIATAGNARISYSFTSTGGLSGYYTYTGWTQPEGSTTLYGYPGPASAWLTSGTSSETESVPEGQEWVDSAVDYRNDVPVYAQLAVATKQRAASASNTVDGSYEAVITVNGATFGYTVDGGIGQWHAAVDASCDSTASSSHSVSETLTDERVLGGLRTDWIELVSTSTTTGTYSESGSQTASGSTPAQNAELPPDATSEGTANPDFAPPRDVFFDYPAGSYSGTLTVSAGAEEQLEETKYLLAYLDLRRRDIAYVKQVYSQATTYAGSGSKTGSEALDNSSPGWNPVMAGSTTVVRETSGQAVVSFGNSTVLDEAFALEPEVSTTTTTNSSITVAQGTVTNGMVFTTPDYENAGGMFMRFYGAFRCGVGGYLPSALGTLQDTHVLTASEPETGGGASSSDEPGVPETQFLRGTIWATYAVADHFGDSGFREYGSWASYKNRYAFSFFVPVKVTNVPPAYELERRQGVGRIGTSPVSLFDVTGVDASEVVRFEPITFIPPTSKG